MTESNLKGAAVIGRLTVIIDKESEHYNKHGRIIKYKDDIYYISTINFEDSVIGFKRDQIKVNYKCGKIIPK